MCAAGQCIFNLAFGRHPLLADALEDAVYINAGILVHCRESGEHVRGCWKRCWAICDSDAAS
jgi:hypothetical protein